MAEATRRRVGGLLCAALIVGAGCEQMERPAALAAAAPLEEGNPIGPIPGAGAKRAEPVNPYRGDAQARADGRRFFVAFNCSGCHGGHGGGGMGPSLRDPQWIYGGSEADIFDSIAQGRAYGMPAWGTSVPADLIWRITTYVASLGTPNEPDPPR